MTKYWLGKKRPDIAEKSRIFMTGRKHSEATKAKMSLSRSGEKSGSWKGGLPLCQICNIKLSRYDAKYCKKHSGFSRKGDKNHNWAGGATNKNRLERVKFRNSMQQSIFFRDNYTCTVCHQIGGYLQVDHIKSWANYPELRFDENNCRTLCMACHYYVTFKKKIPKGIIWGHNLNRRIAS